MTATPPARYVRRVSAFDVVLGLGANQGDCLDTLLGATAQVCELGRLKACSRLYRTAPIGPEQPDFFNAALLLYTSHELPVLLESLLAIERRAGRIRDVRWGPRVLDMDSLWARGVEHRGPNLVVPHVHLRSRAFALLPLLDVAPEAGDASGPYAEALVEVAGQRCEVVHDARWTVGAATALS